jgi:DNA transposition AAA+ family ATPase
LTTETRDEKIRALLAPVTGKRRAQLERRDWRTKERKAHPKPLSTKTVYRTVLVDVVPAPKKRGSGK